MWAVCTEVDKRDNQWDAEEFFASGRREIEQVMCIAESLERDVPRKKALDFGCGVGRLTQALALHFDRCVGVDIASQMVGLAQEYNSFGERCSYEFNEHDHLGILTDGSFDFVYCSRVLQHMEPAYSLNYVREFLRVLSPDGLLVFQLPSAQHGLKKTLKQFLPSLLVNLMRQVVYRSTAVMEMYTVEEEVVHRVIEEVGGKVVHCEYNQASGPDYVSPVYYVAH
jgi:2-polyprenyl-3-methyl-5-hydroxy-6-metoxy-1,4-benzoquinol methylase